MNLAWAAFVGMLREEWRLHARLFGGVRFAAFPFLIASIGAGAAWLLSATGTTAAALVAGLHALVFAFGLHTGSIGFLGRDASRNLLGDVTLLVFSARTLPVSPRRLVGVFLAKDAAYYAGLFLLPLSVAVVLVAGPGFLPRLPLLWASVAGTFILGAAVTFAAVALSTRLPRPVAAALVVAPAVGAWLAGIDPVALTPYGVYRSPAIGSVPFGAAPILVLLGVGVAAYDPTYRRAARTERDRFAAWRRRLGDEDGLVTRSLLDVSRSSGGFGKVLFSGGVLFAVVAALLRAVEPIAGVSPSVGVSFGALLGLSAFTTYNWLTQYDSLESYLIHPVDAGAVFRAKFRGFLALGVSTALAYYALAVALFGGRPGEVLAGALLAVGGLVYLFGITTYLAGFEPGEFLFDPLLFAAFALAVNVGVVPVLIVGFVLAPLPPALLAAVAAAGIALAGAGGALYRRSIPRWERRYRRR